MDKVCVVPPCPNCGTVNPVFCDVSSLLDILLIFFSTLKMLHAVVRSVVLFPFVSTMSAYNKNSIRTDPRSNSNTKSHQIITELFFCYRMAIISIHRWQVGISAAFQR
jgi:hypothetical protein